MMNKTYCMSCGTASLSEPLKPKPAFCGHCGKAMVVASTATPRPVSKPVPQVTQFVVPDEPTEPDLDHTMKLEYEIEAEPQGRTLTLGELLESKTPPAKIESRAPHSDPKQTLKEFLARQKNVKDSNE